ncbi:MAG TPA: hypothetical protein VGS41_09085 [Chthonomonadales bacterium]|nr:hypothetical protein [Chthonomonadales bacterium]
MKPKLWRILPVLLGIMAASLSSAGRARAQSTGNGVYGGYTGSSSDLTWTMRIAAARANARQAHARLAKGRSAGKRYAGRTSSVWTRLAKEDREKGYFRIPAPAHTKNSGGGKFASRVRKPVYRRSALRYGPPFRPPVPDHRFVAPVSDGRFHAPISDGKFNAPASDGRFHAPH